MNSCININKTKNLIFGLRNLNLQSKSFYATKTPLEEQQLKIKREFVEHRNSVNISNLFLPKYVEGLKQSITPSLLERSKEKIYVETDFLEFRKYVFDNREDCIKFLIEAKKYIESIKEEYQKEYTKVLDDKIRELEEERIKLLEPRFLKKRKFFFKKNQVYEPTATVNLTNIDPLYNTDIKTIQQLPVPDIKLNTTVVEFEDQMESGIRSLLNGKLPNEITEKDNIILGFDCDWSGLSKYLTGITSKVSVISISNGENTVIFRICNYGLSPFDLLGQLLLHKNIVKTGVRVHKDSNKISKDYGFLPENVIDISFTKQAAIATGKLINGISIEKLAACIFNVNISRSRSLKLSNWASSQGLTNEQIQSLSYNAYYSYKAHFKIQELPADLESSI
ncbi:hypothetical protein DICPUDRAFT_154097 [Dictyostelium purpureum]|uniref:3'-5' exonuclease n=1 Tax=Dictyostelium purpureum TaxID=5786 RepID=F0ZQK3_DICPU|nr:uncharacterized protein DICPUDRAFT_154097 [Dictyostelium purpureum]EGC33781.1 hypothetical protein DICPUDRAFT_154097 [Dictyostelium purpureum]|eukprot:XP_003289706.1 hypothetical protein DICPUDRAFT_154097 [Dictyostelium purpureum]